MSKTLAMVMRPPRTAEIGEVEATHNYLFAVKDRETVVDTNLGHFFPLASCGLNGLSLLHRLTPDDELVEFAFGRSPVTHEFIGHRDVDHST